MGADHRDFKIATGKHIGSTIAASYIGSKTGGDTTIGPLGAPQAKLEDRQIAAGFLYSSRFGRHQSGEAHIVEQRGLHKLSLDNRPAYPNEGLMTENDGSFRNAVHI